MQETFEEVEEELSPFELAKPPSDEELVELLKKRSLVTNHKEMGWHIFHVSLDEYYKLFIDDGAPYHFIEFLRHEGDLNLTLTNWMSPPETKYEKAWGADTLKYKKYTADI